MRRSASLMVALCLALSGCTRFIHGRAGFAMGSAGRPTAAIEASGGYGLGREEAAVGVDFAGRLKFNSVLSSGAVAAGPWFAVNRGRLLAFGHAGVNLLQLDVIGGTFYASAFSPFAQLGLGVNLSRERGGHESGQILSMNPDTNNIALTLSAAAEYNVRFATAGESFFSVLLGLAFMRAVASESDPPAAATREATDAAASDAATAP